MTGREKERENPLCVLGAWMLWHFGVASDDEVTIITLRDKNIISQQFSMKRGGFNERAQDLTCRHGEEELYTVEEEIR